MSALFLRLVSLLLMLAAVPAAAAETPIVIDSPEGHPYAYRENGRMTGLFHDLVIEAFRRAHHPVEIRFIPWARAMEEVRQGRADGMFVVYKTAERERDFAFPEEPLTQLRERIFVRRTARFDYMDDFANFDGRRVGMLNYTVHGAKLSQALEERRVVSLISASSYESLVDMLASGRLDIAIGVDDAIIDAVLSQKVDDKIREIEPAIDTIPAYLVFARDPRLSEIAADFDRALRSMKQDGTYDRIVASYPRKSLK
jgi:polar amino acid transport system substrate-binding protein